jgi:hypothetical protein
MQMKQAGFKELIEAAGFDMVEKRADPEIKELTVRF